VLLFVTHNAFYRAFGGSQIFSYNIHTQHDAATKMQQGTGGVVRGSRCMIHGWVRGRLGVDPLLGDRTGSDSPSLAGRMRCSGDPLRI